MSASCDVVYDLSENAKCDINDKTVCKLRSTIGMAADINGFTDINQVQFASPKMQKIFDEQRASKCQILDALDEWTPTVSSERQQEAGWLREIVAMEV